MLARNETELSMERFNNSENHSIIITIKAMLKIRVRYLLKASAESKKINVKQILYKILCDSIGKKGIKNIVKITKSNKTELLLVKNPADTSL
jgi:spore coat protein CotF